MHQANPLGLQHSMVWSKLVFETAIKEENETVLNRILFKKMLLHNSGSRSARCTFPSSPSFNLGGARG